MSLVWKDRVLETSLTTGTGTLTLAGAVSGYQAFSAIGNGNTVEYCIEAVDSNNIPTGDWETGLGTYTLSGTTLARTTVYDSSNTGSHVNFSGGTKRVFGVELSTFLSSLATTAATLQVANNLSDLASAGTARTNLGLGSSATHAATDFLLAANNLSDLANAGTARTNLGLGSAATHPSTDFDSSGAAAAVLATSLQKASNLSDLASATTARTNLVLGNVENTALSTWAGSANITTLGTIASGSIPYSLLTGTPTVPSAANPTGTIGTSAVNGSAATFMRSDAAPAFDLTIARTWTGVNTFAPTARSTGVAAGLVYTGPADTGTTTLTERNSLLIDTSATVGWASGTGTLATQRNALIKAPTYTCASAITITSAATFAIDKAPVAAGSVTITNPWSLWVQGGTARFDGGINLALGGNSIFGQGLNIGTDARTGNIAMYTAGVIRWNVISASGDFTPNADNFYNFGGTTVRIKNVYVATQAIWGTGAADDTGLKRTAAGVLAMTNGSSGTGWLQNSAGRARNTADVTNATATMANLTDLSQTYIAGRKYFGFVLVFANNSTGAEGLQFDLAGGSATFTSIEFGFCGTPLGATLGTGSSTAAGTAITATVVSTSDVAYLIAVTFVINATGTVIPRGAEASPHTTGTATFRLGSFYLMEDSPN